MHYDNYNLHCVISIHALLAESDGFNPIKTFIILAFLSTLSLRRATVSTTIIIICTALFLSTLSLRRATRYGRPIDVQFLFLSTLSLRRATDWPPVRDVIQWISIHALLAESDRREASESIETLHFYPRSPCGERLVILRKRNAPLTISIHALLAESDMYQYEHYV